jgi:exosortase A
VSTAFSVEPVRRVKWKEWISGAGWSGHLGMLTLGWLAVIALFFGDFTDMVSIWWNASTFNHCLFIPFIAGWLAYQRRDEVVRFTPHAWLPGVIFVAGAGLVWMVGEAAGVGQFRHIGLILMLQSMVLALLGPNVTRALLFPLFYLSFMVPAGEELVPYLQTLTAKMSMILLGLFQVPAHINGIFITISNGYFEVAEACSGVKFLVAMVAYGALVCNLCFRSWKRRALFMAASILVPILANGVRAFGTIYVAHLTSVASAEGFDHVVYGWFFFGIVMALVMAMGWRFFDRGPGDRWLENVAPVLAFKARSVRLTLAAACVALLLPIAWQAGIAATGQIAMPNTIALPAISGWTRSEASGTAWSPSYSGADHQLLGHYTNLAGDQVDLSITLYGWQDEGREIVGYGQGIAPPDGTWTWAAETPSPDGGKADRIVAAGPVNREVLTYYVTDAGRTGSASDVKITAAKHRLFGGDQAVGVLHVSAAELPDRPARAVLNGFVKAMGPPEDVVQRLIRSARGG